MKPLELFAENHKLLSARFFEQRTFLSRAGAMLLTAAGRKVEPSRLDRAVNASKNLLEREGLHTPELLPMTSAFLLLTGDMDRAAFRLRRGLRALKRVFFPSAQLLWAGCLMALLAPEDGDYDALAAQAKQLYTDMERLQPFCTSYQDIPVCVLYALRGEREADNRLVDCVNWLRPTFRLRNSVQALAQVLAIQPEPQVCCQRTLELYRAFLSHGLRLGRGISLTALGVLAGIDLPADAMAERTAELCRQLDHTESLNLWGIGRKERLLWSAMLTALEQQEERPTQSLRDSLLCGVMAVAAVYTPDALPGAEQPGEFTL